MASSYVHADAMVDLCQRDVRQQTIERAKQKESQMSAKQIALAVDGGIPAAEYVVQADTAVCVAEKMKLALDKPANFENYCFMAKVKTRVECFQVWQRKQEISYAKQVVQLAQTAHELAKKDLTTPNVDIARVSATAIDIWLSELERYSVTKNVAFKSAGGVEREKLKVQERADYKKAHKALLEMAEGEFRSLNALTQAMPKSQAANLKQATVELTALRGRIVKLKAVSK